MISYFLHFFLLLIAGAIVINGWFMVTRGQWKEEVDGTRSKEGALLKGWWFFWFQEDGNMFNVYGGDKLVSIVDQISAHQKFRSLNLRIEHDNVVASDLILHKTTQAQLREAFGVDIAVHQQEGDKVWCKLAKMEPRYKYPYWIRTMLAGCITCFSSLYGSAVFWTAYCYFGKDWFGGDPFSRCMLVFLTWIAYMLALAYMNTYLYKKASN